MWRGRKIKRGFQNVDSRLVTKTETLWFVLALHQEAWNRGTRPVLWNVIKPEVASDLSGCRILQLSLANVPDKNVAGMDSENKTELLIFAMMLGVFTRNSLHYRLPPAFGASPSAAGIQTSNQTAPEFNSTETRPMCGPEFAFFGSDCAFTPSQTILPKAMKWTKQPCWGRCSCQMRPHRTFDIHTKCNMCEKNTTALYSQSS